MLLLYSPATRPPHPRIHPSHPWRPHAPRQAVFAAGGDDARRASDGELALTYACLQVGLGVWEGEGEGRGEGAPSCPAPVGMRRSQGRAIVRVRCGARRASPLPRACNRATCGRGEAGEGEARAGAPACFVSHCTALHCSTAIQPLLRASRVVLRKAPPGNPLARSRRTPSPTLRGTTASGWCARAWRTWARSSSSSQSG